MEAGLLTPKNVFIHNFTMHVMVPQCDSGLTVVTLHTHTEKPSFNSQKTVLVGPKLVLESTRVYV
jgi:hypothetical protein